MTPRRQPANKKRPPAQAPKVYGVMPQLIVHSPNFAKPREELIPQGEYYKPGGDAEDLVACNARTRFLLWVQVLAPEVLGSLRDDVSPAFRALYRRKHRRRTRDWNFDHWWRWSDLRRAGADLPRDLVAPLREALLSWAKRFHLTDEWVLDQALMTLRVWEEAGQGADRLSWFLPQVENASPISDVEGMFAFLTLGWGPAVETWAEANARIRRAFDRYLNHYRCQIEGLCEQRGWKRTPHKRRGSPHLVWLLLYQVKGWRYGEIARKHHADRNTVKDGIQSVADLIGLTVRRAGPPGRPRKT